MRVELEYPRCVQIKVDLMDAIALSQLQKDYCILEMQDNSWLSIKQ